MISIDLESNSTELKFRKSAEVEDGGRIDELVCVKVGDGCVKASVMEEFLVDFEGGFHRRMQEIIENLVAGKLKSMVVEVDFESHNELPYYYLSEDEVAHHVLNSKQNRKWKKRVKSGPAEKKTKSPESSPAPSATSPQSQTSSPAATKDETFNSELEVSDIKEAEEMEPVSESNGGDSELKEDAEQDENGTDSSQSTFSYDQLKAKSDNPITGIDFKRRETYLSDEEFESIFGATKEAFYKLPKWKQDMQKRKVDLF